MAWTKSLFLSFLAVTCNAAPLDPLASGENFSVHNNANISLNRHSLDERAITKVTVTYRPDRRDPEQIWKAWGFKSSEYIGRSGRKIRSLYQHIEEAAQDADGSGYVYTTPSLRHAKKMLCDHSGADKCRGFIYTITLWTNLIDVDETLQDWVEFEGPELAGQGKIEWDQIEGWAEAFPDPDDPDGARLGPFERNSLHSREYAESNPNYRRDGCGRHATKKFEMAGFPRGHPAWKQWPWKDVCPYRPNGQERAGTQHQKREDHIYPISFNMGDNIKSVAPVALEARVVSKKKKGKGSPLGTASDEGAETRCTAAMKKAGTCQKGAPMKDTEVCTAAGGCGNGKTCDPEKEAKKAALATVEEIRKARKALGITKKKTLTFPGKKRTGKKGPENFVLKVQGSKVLKKPKKSRS